MTLRWALFDLNGTLLDPSGIGAPLGLGREDSAAALDEAILLSMAESLSGSYRPLPELLRAVLLRRDGGPGAGLDEALERATRMPPYPDAAPALDRLREADLRIGVLTNSATAAAEGALEAAGLRDRVSLVVGSDRIEVFKPDPRLYRLGAERTGARLEEICMIAAHAWDLMGAGRVGMRTAWVAREEKRWLEYVPEPDARGESLDQTARAIVASDAKGQRREV